ncbi:hypothetical protein SORBI_3001G410300 [Sorghum bicolor]|uniref:Uncharacterized protein n=1 Tax=Sorghum bicolor TaxID=4558 RepID=A0A1B6QNZ2_SORBI|nr:hypothetical protein SORBI_3001G410300 [Sorghum bicolor]
MAWENGYDERSPDAAKTTFTRRRDANSLGAAPSIDPELFSTSYITQPKQHKHTRSNLYTTTTHLHSTTVLHPKHRLKLATGS